MSQTIHTPKQEASATLNAEAPQEPKIACKEKTTTDVKAILDTKPPKESWKEKVFLIKKLMKLFAPYKLLVIVSILASLVVGIATGATAYIVRPALDDIFLNKNEQLLYLIPLALIGISLLKGVARYCQNYFMTICGLRVIEDLRILLFNKLIQLPTAYHTDSTVGEMMSRVMNDVGALRTSVPAMIMMTRQAFTVLCLVFAVVYQNPALSLYSMITIPVAFYPLLIFSKKIKAAAGKSINLGANITSQLQETFSGISVIKAFSTEKIESKEFIKTNKEILKLSLKQTRISEMASPIMELIGSLGIGATILFGGYEVIHGNMTPGAFFSFLVAVIMMYEPIKSIMMYNTTLQNALVSAERVYTLLDSPIDREETGGDIELEAPISTIEYRNVTMQYSENANKALDDFSITIQEGERIALVGPSGAGKTTFVGLLSRFYDIQKGTILIKNRPIEEYSLTSLRRNIASVAQTAYLFNRSIAENIAYGDTSETLDMEKIITAAKLAYADDFIQELPEGYNTKVGDTGSKLSGGQRQRITIARAIFKNSPILILDEATSALDSESEEIIQKALINLMVNKTSIVIAHRLSTILSADRIAVMNKGKLEAIGSHTELLQTSPLYQKLYSLQFKTEGIFAQETV